MHVMLIPDGDRRYALKHNVSLLAAYEQAAEVARKLVEWVLVDGGADEFTFFGLSLANIAGRKTAELRPIMDVQTKSLRDLNASPLLRRHGIRVLVHGESKMLPREYRAAIHEIESATESYRGKTLNLLLAYSGMDDLAQAIRATVESKERPSMENVLAHCMIHSPIDFLFRTANEKRVSDGPLFLMPYTEFEFIPNLFPELTKADILKALSACSDRKRTFGV